MSLDGYITGPNEEIDWILMDPDIDFEALMNRFDVLLMGRRTFEFPGQGPMLGKQVLVASRTLRPEDHPNVTIISDEVEETVRRLREEPGKDIWLFGGGVLFRSMLNAGLVDSVEVAVIPILLGEGTPVLPTPGARVMLRLTGSRVYEKTGTVFLEYAVETPGT